VQRDDEARPRGIEPFAQRGVIGAVEPRQPPLDIGTDIAGDEVAVARLRHDPGRVFLAVQVAHEARDAGDVRRDRVPPRHALGDAFDADIDGDMLVQQLRRDPQVDVGRDVAGRVIDDADDTATNRLAYLAERAIVGHRSAPFICHQPGWAAAIRAAASSRAPAVS
jgi:hypothetical protein